jgi:hypothetical protein
MSFWSIKIGVLMGLWIEPIDKELKIIYDLDSSGVFGG